MKNKLATLALSGVMLVSGTAFGMDFDPKFYLGGEAQLNKLKNGQNFQDTNGKSMIRKKSPSLGAFLGTRFNEYLGAELGYTALKTSKQTLVNNNTLTVKMRNPYLDVLGYIPVANDVDVIGSIGVGRLQTKTSMKAANNATLQLTSMQHSDAKAKAGVRLGVGAQYKFDTNFGGRVMLRHQKGNKAVKNVDSAGLSLFYQL
jgi:hypothetical protein